MIGTEATSSSISDFNRFGFSVFKAMSASEQETVEKFTTDWIYRLLSPWTEGREKEFPLDQYHNWSKELPADHRSVFKALNRYQYPPAEVRSAIINDRTKSFLKEAGLSRYKVWDDGWGDVGFRLIRPGMKDGYPFCAKDWGIAKDVVSFWIPVVGRSSNETLALVPSSHLLDYPKEVATDGFARGEPRFAGDVSSLNIIRPSLKAGEVIAYHCRTVHSEDVTNSDITRINLEIRFQPISD